MTFLVAVLVGWLVSRARGPGEGVPRPRWLTLLILAAAVQIGAAFLDEDVRDELVDPGLVITNVAVGTFFVANSLRPGPLRLAFVAATIGWAMNAAVVAANGAMPVSLAAATQAGFASGTDVASGFLYEHEAETASTRLRPLGDVIPVPAGPVKEVISAGDVVLAAGVALAASHLFRARLDEVSVPANPKEVT